MVAQKLTIQRNWQRRSTDFRLRTSNFEIQTSDFGIVISGFSQSLVLAFSHQTEDTSRFP